MHDREIVASIVAGEPDGLTAAYDRYATALFRYCRFMLQDPDDAADAVQDTFVIAASKLTLLRNRERLRAWLFAVARNECLHRLRARRAVLPIPDIPEEPDENAEVSQAAERAEIRALLRTAAGGLTASEQDVITQFWHGMEVPEIAAVLGISRNHAHSLFARARDHLKTSLAVLVVGRSGRQDCAALNGLLRDWDGRLTTTLRKRAGRHIDQCATCAARQQREMRDFLLSALVPAALPGLAAPPSGLRGEILRLAGGQGLPAAGAQVAAGHHLRAFRLGGFPKPLHAGHPPLLPITHLQLGMAGGTAAAAAATVLATGVLPGSHSGPATPPGGSIGLPGLSAAPTVPRQARRPEPGAGTPVPPPRQPLHSSPAPRDGDTPPSRRSPGPTGSPSPTATLSATATPVPGTLSVSPGTVVLSVPLGGTLTLTANGGPVSWSISEAASLIGSVTASPSAGVLNQAGDSVAVRITVTGLASLDTTLTVNPGALKVTVVLGLG